jgi:hypothetical protein
MLEAGKSSFSSFRESLYNIVCPKEVILVKKSFHTQSGRMNSTKVGLRASPIIQKSNWLINEFSSGKNL